MDQRALARAKEASSEESTAALTEAARNGRRTLNVLEAPTTISHGPATDARKVKSAVAPAPGREAAGSKGARAEADVAAGSVAETEAAEALEAEVGQRS